MGTLQNLCQMYSLLFQDRPETYVGIREGDIGIPEEDTWVEYDDGMPEIPGTPEGDVGLPAVMYSYDIACYPCLQWAWSLLAITVHRQPP
jgi:hypothetical protein